MSKFEDLYKKYLNNTATPEERLYIEKILKEASELIDNEEKPSVDTKVEESTIRKFYKGLKKKILRKSILITLIVLVIVVLTAGGVIGGVSYNAAKSNEIYNKDEILEIVTTYVNDNADKYGLFESINDVDKDFELIFPRLSKSYFEYEVMVKTDKYYLEIEVNAKSGLVYSKIKHNEHNENDH